MKVLLSIKPEFAEMILSGAKRYEYRKTIFKNNEVETAVIYATLPIGKVVGEFQIGGILEDTPAALWERTKEHAGVSEDIYQRYFKGCETARAIQVANPKRYAQPLSLLEATGSTVAPQSFRYLEKTVKDNPSCFYCGGNHPTWECPEQEEETMNNYTIKLKCGDESIIIAVIEFDHIAAEERAAELQHDMREKTGQPWVWTEVVSHGEACGR